MRLLSPGQKLRDTYEVERFLGEGAFAEVYRVRHRFMGRQAMKIFKAPGATMEEIERDVGEALILSCLKHPNIVDVYDANVMDLNSQRFGYFTMTYVPGGTLDRYWRSFGANLMPTMQSVDAVRQACRGLAVAHASVPPIVHRDIKPQNILVGIIGKDLTIRLSDFGLAKAVNPLTLLATSRGTMGFKPPESLRNMDSCAADVWALGTTLYLLLTDQMPFPLLSEREVEDASHFLRPIRPPSLYNVDVDPGLESIIYRCLASSPRDRYQDAAELLTDLEKWTPGFRQSSRSSSHCERSAKPLATLIDPHNLKDEALEALRQATQMALDPTRLSWAADLLEEAMSMDPGLRDRYQDQLQLWRRGVMQVPVGEPRYKTKQVLPKSGTKTD